MNHDFSNIAFRMERASRARPSPFPEEVRFSVQKRRIGEAFRGSDIVVWQGKIERQLEDFAEDSDDSRNHDYAAKLRQFLKMWRANTLDGNVNIETVNTLLAAAEVPSVDDWRYRNYFSELRDQLRRLKASTEELPFGDTVPPEQRAPMSSPPASFGAEGEPSPGELPGEVPPGEGAPPEGSLQPDAAQAAGDLTGEAPIEDEEPVIPVR